MECWQHIKNYFQNTQQNINSMAARRIQQFTNTATVTLAGGTLTSTTSSIGYTVRQPMRIKSISVHCIGNTAIAWSLIPHPEVTIWSGGSNNTGIPQYVNSGMTNQSGYANIITPAGYVRDLDIVLKAGDSFVIATKVQCEKTDVAATDFDISFTAVFEDDDEEI